MRVCPKCSLPYPNTVERCVRDNSSLTTVQEIIDEFSSLGTGSLIGQVIDKYKLVERLGTGGMGAVYLATHLSIGKEVAIKVIREDVSTKDHVLELFFQEARALARLSHENIVQIIDFGCTPEGITYLVMELLVGFSLGDVLEREQVLSPARAKHIALQICRGLSAAHQLGIVHRDLKPDNVFLTRFREENDFVKIVDFGIAKQVDPHAPQISIVNKNLVGTPAYMSPEQGSDIDARSDIYSLGVILYRMLTGQVPFEGKNAVDVLYKHLTEPPKPLREILPGVPPALEGLVLRAMAKDKAERFSSMTELENALLDIDVQATTPIILPDEPKPIARPRHQTTLSGTASERVEVQQNPSKLPWVGGGLGVVALGGLLWLALGASNAAPPVAPPPALAAGGAQLTSQPTAPAQLTSPGEENPETPASAPVLAPALGTNPEPASTPAPAPAKEKAASKGKPQPKVEPPKTPPKKRDLLGAPKITLE